MPTSLPPLPSEMGDSPSASPGGEDTQTASAFSGGMPTMMQALQMIETGCKMLATQVPSLLPMCAQTISQFRTAVPAATGAGAGADASGQPPPGPGGTSPAMTGMGQNPQTLPAPPQGA